MTFPDALLSEEEFEAFARAVPGPKMMNMGGYAARRTTPKMPLEFLERIGFNVAIFPLAMLRAGRGPNASSSKASRRAAPPSSASTSRP